MCNWNPTHIFRLKQLCHCKECFCSFCCSKVLSLQSNDLEFNISIKILPRGSLIIYYSSSWENLWQRELLVGRSFDKYLYLACELHSDIYEKNWNPDQNKNLLKGRQHMLWSWKLVKKRNEIRKGTLL